MHNLMAFVLGAIYCVGFAPFDLWPVTLISIAGFYLLLVSAKANPVWLAFFFGLGKYGAGTSWVYVSIHVYGNASPVLAGVLVVLFSATLALFVLPIGWGFKVAKPNTHLRAILVFTVTWLLCDWLLSWLFTGFPWLYPGYSVMHTPIVGWAPVLGVLGVSALFVLSLVCVVESFRQKIWWLAAAGLVPWAAGGLLHQIDWAKPVTEHQVALVQGNVPQSTKWDPGQANAILNKYTALTAQHWDADVVVWPEAAITYYAQNIEGVLEQIDSLGKRTGTDLITGIPSIEKLPGGEYLGYNTALGLGQARGQFAKQHLVPFGEYVPFASVLRGLIEFFDLPMSRMTAGSATQVNISGDVGRYALAICYEIAYPNSMRLRARDAQVLATITNDTWFGASIGPHQHMQIAQMRALENARWLLRAANDGITAVVDHRGQITHRLEQFTEGVLRGSFFVMQGRTPYSFVGDWPVLGCLLLGLICIFRWRTR